MSYRTDTDTDAAPRTRGVLLLLLPCLTGVFVHIIYGPPLGLWGFAGGAVTALVLCALIGRAAQRRGGRVVQRRGGRR